MERILILSLPTAENKAFSTYTQEVNNLTQDKSYKNVETDSSYKGKKIHDTQPIFVFETDSST